MLRYFFFLIVIFAFTISVGFGQQKALKERDEAAIGQIVKQMEDGWNAGDGKAFAAPFAMDADYVIVNGLQIKGRDEIEKGHTQIFSTVYKGSRNAGTVKSIRFLRSDVAVAHVEWNLRYMTNGEEHRGNARNTLILTKENGKWSIAAFQNTPIQSLAGK